MFKSKYFILVLICLFIIGYALLLYVLNISGFIIFVNRIAWFQKYLEHLGTSVYLFSANFSLSIIAFVRLQLAFETNNDMGIKYWNLLLNNVISLFFGIGVIYTAVGMQRAFQVALGNVDQATVMSMGPWGVLQNLVEGGLLMALYTTIVGGGLGYTIRLIKFLIFGKRLIQKKDELESQHHLQMISLMQDIKDQLKTAQQN